MQLFSANTTIFKKQLNCFFALENIKKRPQKLLIIGPNFFFRIANRTKTSTNLNFCSIKIALRATLDFNKKSTQKYYVWLHCAKNRQAALLRR